MAITNDNFCLTVMKELAAVSGTDGDPLKNRLKTGLLDALTTAQNVGGTEIDQLYDQKDGKDHKVILKYLKPDSISEVSDSITDICDDEGAESSYVFDEVSLNLQVQSPVKKLTHTQMRALCEEGAEFERMKLIASMFSAVEKNMNQQLITSFAAGAGGIYNGNGATGTGYNFLHTETLTEVDPTGYVNMTRDLMDTGMVGNPLVIAGGIFDSYARRVGIGCCNNYGAAIDKLSDLGYYYDNDLQTILSSPSSGNEFLVFAPGAAQLVTKPMNQGQFRIVQDRDLWDTITNPATGITYDFYKRFDPCPAGGGGPVYTMKIALNFDLWQLPLDMFKSGDPRYGINFNFLFNALQSTGS